jgi:hypothetical protein
LLPLFETGLILLPDGGRRGTEVPSHRGPGARIDQEGSDTQGSVSSLLVGSRPLEDQAEGSPGLLAALLSEAARICPAGWSPLARAGDRQDARWCRKTSPRRLATRRYNNRGQFWKARCRTDPFRIGPDENGCQHGKFETVPVAKLELRLPAKLMPRVEEFKERLEKPGADRGGRLLLEKADTRSASGGPSKGSRPAKPSGRRSGRQRGRPREVSSY